MSSSLLSQLLTKTGVSKSPPKVEVSNAGRKLKINNSTDHFGSLKKSRDQGGWLNGWKALLHMSGDLNLIAGTQTKTVTQGKVNKNHLHKAAYPALHRCCGMFTPTRNNNYKK